MMIPTVLIIEDEAALCAALETALRRTGCAVETAASGAAGLARLNSKEYSAVVMDIGLPDMSGLSVLKELRSASPDIPVLVVTAHGHLENAIAARTAGATEYLVKPLDLGHFKQTVRSLLEKHTIQARPHAIHNERPPLFVGGAPSLQSAFSAIAKACSGTGPVLITGPSGCGKTLAAHIIHAQSSRAELPLLTIPANLLTPAKLEESRVAAQGATLLLEEITLLPEDTQFLLGTMLSTEMLQPEFVRVVATTRHNLRDAAQVGKFREDLYYYLSVSEVPLPPLCERRSDIPALAATLLARKDTGNGALEITPSALSALQTYHWPGNVRELGQVLHYAVSTSRGRAILLSHLPGHVSASVAGPSNAFPSLKQSIHEWLDEVIPAASPPAYDDLMDELEKHLLSELLPRFEHKPTRLAAALKIHRTTLRQKMARLDMGLDAEG